MSVEQTLTDQFLRIVGEFGTTYGPLVATIGVLHYVLFKQYKINMDAKDKEIERLIEMNRAYREQVFRMLNKNSDPLPKNIESHNVVAVKSSESNTDE